MVLARRILIGMIVGYQRIVSPVLGTRCRFYPSCSEYARLSLHKFETHQALVKTIIRLAKCHPFHPGGVDWP